MVVKENPELDESCFLYYRIEKMVEDGMLTLQDIPNYVLNNLSRKFVIRDYQEKAFKNVITYLNGNSLRKNKQIHLLFHMATGSGKTYIMAGLILYLYKIGYKDFVFFVNQGTIVEKTKKNFLDKSFGKYLFNEKIIIDGETIEINLSENFQESNNNSINIKFTTIQKLHEDLGKNQENSITIQDFEDRKVVLIADESHHINSDTKKKLNKNEQMEKDSWEKSINNIFNANKDNMLFEFTATCDLKNKNVIEKYKDKIIFNYTLLKFREDEYTKDFLNLQSTFTPMMRVVQAMLLSQYRLKLFADYKKNIKPVILLKSKSIAENRAFYNEFILYLNNSLSIDDILFIKNQASGITKKMFDYFDKISIDYEILVQELKESFSENHLIIMDGDDKELSEKNKIVNDLENIKNPYRMLFTVDMLNEGWDVLNLFDIVRLYSERQGGKKISKSTITEAQLIGRGVRYQPFKIYDTDEANKRKYDIDSTNELRVCETLYYHSQQDSKYIEELRKALKEIGFEAKNICEFEYVVKDEFIENPIYKNGKLFINKYVKKSKDDIIGIPENCNSNVEIDLCEYISENSLVSNENLANSKKENIYTNNYKVKDIATTKYPVVLKALRQYPIMRFSTLKGYFPKLNSIEEFLSNSNYAGRFELTIKTNYDTPNNIDIYKGLLKLFDKLSTNISNIKEEFEGTKDFIETPLKNYVKNTLRVKVNPDKEGEGVSQNDINVNAEYRLNLANEDWFVYNDNYGTTEEKKFVKYFSNKVNDLKSKYSEVYLIRNERKLKIYSFDDGARFEPDYILLLREINGVDFIQQQIFIEPKGTHLLKQDEWKEKFLMQIEHNSNAILFHEDGSEYKIIGLPFYNKECRLDKFNNEFEKLITNTPDISDDIGLKEIDDNIPVY